MQNQSTSNLTVGGQLAEFIRERREKIISEWMSNVCIDRELKTADTLSPEQIKDHFPSLLEHLCEGLKAAFDPEVKDRAASTAATHGLQRWQTGYDIFELLHELALMRTVLIRQLVDFREHHQEMGGAANLFAECTVHRFLDDAMCVSVGQYLAAKHFPAS